MWPGRLEETILREGPETVAAFVAEPLVAAALGAVPPPDDQYFKEIRRICSAYGVLFIADEVMTGFGRTGANFAIQHYGVTPDIIACGKGISGGYFPVGGVLIHNAVSKAFIQSGSYFMSGSTYACNPMAAAVGSAVIDYIDRLHLVENSKRMGDLLYEKLQRLYEHKIVGDIRGRGLLLAIEFVKNAKTKEPFPAAAGINQRILDAAISFGGIFYPGKGCADGVNGDHLMVMPPLVVTASEIEEVVAVLDKAIGVISSSHV